MWEASFRLCYLLQYLWKATANGQLVTYSAFNSTICSGCDTRLHATLLSPRPTGVSVLTALVIIGGIVDILTALFSVIVAGASLPWLGPFAGLGVGGILLWLLSLGLLACAIICFILAYGLWNGHSWAWTWTLISSVLGLIISIPGIAVGTGVLGIVIYAAIIYYLTRTKVKSFFGKGSTQYHQ